MNIPIANRSLRLRILRKYNARKSPDAFASGLTNAALMACICLEEALKIAEKYQPKTNEK